MPLYKCLNKCWDALAAGKGYLRMDTEITTAKSSARERLGLDKPTSTKTAGRTSAAQADKKVIFFVCLKKLTHYLFLLYCNRIMKDDPR